MTQEKIKEIKEQNDGVIVLFRTEKGCTLYGADVEVFLHVMDSDNDALYDVHMEEKRILCSVSFCFERIDLFLPKLIRAGYKVAIYDDRKVTE